MPIHVDGSITVDLLTVVQVRLGDRCLSWLPFYHDIRLVGMMLAPLACHLSVDHLKARYFAMRPRPGMG